MKTHKSGPKPGKNAARNAKIIECYQTYSADEAAKRFKLSKAAIYKIVRAYRAAQKEGE
jgi:transposase